MSDIATFKGWNHPVGVDKVVMTLSQVVAL